jgi:hypothetical protein
LCFGAPSLASANSGRSFSENARLAMQQKFDGDGIIAMYKLQVERVVLINTSGKRYRGTATVKFPFKNDRREIPIEVNADRENTMWRADLRPVRQMTEN